MTCNILDLDDFLRSIEFEDDDDDSNKCVAIYSPSAGDESFCDSFFPDTDGDEKENSEDSGKRMDAQSISHDLKKEKKEKRKSLEHGIELQQDDSIKTSIEVKKKKQ